MKIEAYREFEKLSPFEIKDELIALAKESEKKSALAMFNAGRGNPNWVNTTPREGFFLLGQFAITECKRIMDLPDLGGMPKKEGIAERLQAFLQKHADLPGAEFLSEMLPFAVQKFAFKPDEFIHELVDSIIGDNYPVPDRMLIHAEKVVHEYLMWAMCDNRPPSGKFDLYAVEGGTAAMCYVFKALVENRILHKRDTIALGTPIFTPYLEIPLLKDYDLNVVDIISSRESLFQFTTQELDKLADPKVKFFFLVNPANPGSVAVRPDVLDYLVKLVKTKRPDLMILTDDVYGTFVRGFRSLMAELPENTIGVYSYSKYFGCTGWRLGVIAVHQTNIFDNLLAQLPQEDKEALNKRYGSIALHPDKLKFIDRIVADSRDVALNHTAGLSLPQQVQMTLFSLFQLMDGDDSYRSSVISIVERRLHALVEGLGAGIDLKPDPYFAAYYGLLDLEYWLKHHIGDEMCEFIKKNYHPLDLVFRLAQDHSIVLLNGGGFHAADWSARVSFANLPDDVYENIGRAVRAVARTYLEAWRFSKGDTPSLH